jgi:RNA polymerase sigma factor (sigma-70 family)
VVWPRFSAPIFPARIRLLKKLSKKSVFSSVSHCVNLEDQSWVAEALSRYEKPLLRYAAWLLDDRDRARDIVQEVFLRMCRESRDRIGDHVAEWLFKVCRNRALDVRESESRRRKLDETSVIYVSDIVADYARDPMERRELIRQILAMIDTLPANQREAVFLKFHEGFSYKEISELTGHSIGNVGFLIHSAVHTIRQRVQEKAPRFLSRRSE